MKDFQTVCADEFTIQIRIEQREDDCSVVIRFPATDDLCAGPPVEQRFELENGEVPDRAYSRFYGLQERFEKLRETWITKA